MGPGPAPQRRRRDKGARRPGSLATQLPTFPAWLSVFPAGALRAPVATAPPIRGGKVEIIKINLLHGYAMHAMQLEYLVIFQVAAKKHTHSRISARICGAIIQKNRLIARNAPICPGRRPRSSSTVPSWAALFFAPGGPRLPRTTRGEGANTRVRRNNLATPCSTDCEARRACGVFCSHSRARRCHRKGSATLQEGPIARCSKSSRGPCAKKE